VDLRDPYTGGHSRRVAHYCAGIFRQLALVGPEVDLIIAAARVHDIGKIGVPDHILNKPGLLTPEERAIMETHPDRGADLLLRYPDFARGVEIVRHHHESWNGKGYPSKLAGYAIPFGARVIAVADSYDAMTSDRPYRCGMTPARAAQILRERRGEQWDATIVDAFLHSIADQLEAPCPDPQLAALPSHDLVHVETML
jgi:HD-GYP domain-containing protein (c-di-GMP phosphodiesterase class II)